MKEREPFLILPQNFGPRARHPSMAKGQSVITVEDTEIRYYQEQREDYLSLTDIARKFNERTGQLIMNWLRTRSTVSFLGAWEMLHNPVFNVLNFEDIKNRTGEPAFVLTSTDWIERTGAVGIRAKTGRYGGTYAHRDIAFEFLSYLSPTFKLYVFKEFQRLKELESREQRDLLDWDLRRTLAKVNYRIHTDAVQKHLAANRPVWQTKLDGLVFASEADLLNLALFGQTARQWQAQNPELKGNLRDYATAEELLVLANLENLNADYIKNGLPQDERLERLAEAGTYQLALLEGLRLKLPEGGKP